MVNKHALYFIQDTISTTSSAATNSPATTSDKVLDCTLVNDNTILQVRSLSFVVT